MKKLTPQEEQIILHKATEAPFSGKFYRHRQKGLYICRQCGAALYRSENKFDSGCGWPSFDTEIKGAVRQTPDPDGYRTEISCARCGGHLGHIFLGEGFTAKNTRHCVNSLSLAFVPDTLPRNSSSHSVAPEAKTPGTPDKSATSSASANTAVHTPPDCNVAKEAVFAGGCFWGVEHLLGQAPGVLSIQSGYIGGHVPHPTYEQVCTGKTGHYEAVRVLFDPAQISYEALAKLFFEIHDPTQLDGQGPDIGQQYRSALFYADEEQKHTAEKLLKQLQDKGYRIATQLLPRQIFWPAEDYHQHYYQRKGTQPYCHRRVKRFD